MKTQAIYWGDIFCGNVGPPVQPPLHCLHGHRLRRVENNPERGNWDYVCVTCSQLVTPAETPMPDLTPQERAEGVIGRITALPVTIGTQGDSYRLQLQEAQP